ncbi:MAG: LysE family transporter [Bacillota bacterium]|nr:LysE family transporter [Bacillota bacterium]
MLNYITKGIIIGLITGMPLGPIGAVCLRTTLTSGAVYGLVSGLGSAIADSIYATVASVGMAFVAHFILQNKLYLHFGGGLVLIAYGIHMYHSRQKTLETKRKIHGGTLFKSFISTLLLALANPATIFSFVVVFTSSRLSHISRMPYSRTLLILGVFIGSMLWWLILVLGASSLESKFNIKNINFINRILGSIIILSGFVMFLSASNLSRYIMPPILHTKLFEIFLNIKARFPFHKRF